MARLLAQAFARVEAQPVLLAAAVPFARRAAVEAVEVQRMTSELLEGKALLFEFTFIYHFNSF